MTFTLTFMRVDNVYIYIYGCHRDRVFFYCYIFVGTLARTLMMTGIKIVSSSSTVLFVTSSFGFVVVVVMETRVHQPHR